ncbi:hypothetical protein HAX54_039525 [Datura stramonium]|uniref:Uncharacterized protein n=1 Tax=Datura stramonium TaxID=4076 RepID=A0ABS8VN81_DATST|nr:hypothetical protein [Datura stramonium]
MLGRVRESEQLSCWTEGPKRRGRHIMPCEMGGLPRQPHPQAHKVQHESPKVENSNVQADPPDAEKVVLDSEEVTQKLLDLRPTRLQSTKTASHLYGLDWIERSTAT